MVKGRDEAKQITRNTLRSLDIFVYYESIKRELKIRYISRNSFLFFFCAVRRTCSTLAATETQPTDAILEQTALLPGNGEELAAETACQAYNAAAAQAEPRLWDS